MAVIVINAMIVDNSRLSGIGHYIVQLTKYFSRINSDNNNGYMINVVCRADAAHHFLHIPGIVIINIHIREGRAARVIFEQIRMPLLLRRLKAGILLNPAFTGPVWGARHIFTTVHDVYFKIIPELVPPAQRKYLSTFTPWCCRRSWRIITPSAATRADLIQFYPDLASRTVVIPLANRLSITACSTTVETEPVPSSVLLVAALTGNKNPEPLVAAIASLRSRYPELRLLHIGIDSEFRLAEAVLRHNGETWVETRSGVSDADLAEEYRNCLCLVIPSLYEGFGLPLLEAQAFGAPVIASDRGALPEVGGAGAVYVDPTDAEAIAAAIETLITSPARRRKLREAGLANQARFSWENTASMTWNLMTVDATASSTSAETA